MLKGMGQKLSLDTTYQVILLGLDNAGKSTTLFRLKTDKYVETLATIGFNCEKIKPPTGHARHSTFSIWDVGGQEKLRPLWRTYTRQANAIVLVIDSSDIERFEEAKLEITNLLRSSDIPSHIPVLLLANKQDLQEALVGEECERLIGLSGSIGANRPFKTLDCCAITGEGLEEEFFDELYDLILKSKKLEKTKKSNIRTK